MLFVVFVLLSISVSAQKKKGGGEEEIYDEEYLHEADKRFDKGDYMGALPLYLYLYQQHGAAIEWVKRIGICYMYKADETEKSIEHLESLLKKKPKKIEDFYFHLGRAYHVNYKFDQAIEAFNKCLTMKNTTEKTKALIPLYIEYCNIGKTLYSSPVNVSINNIDGPVNTAEREYHPIITADESRLIFTYRGEKSVGGLQNTMKGPFPGGEYMEDVFISYKTPSGWSEPMSLSESVNTMYHDASVSLSVDGGRLFIYKDSYGTSGDIYISELKGNTWQEPVTLYGDVNSVDWESGATLSPDGKTLYFSSNRAGGKGGKDLYKASLLPDSTWGNVENLGDVINTPNDEEGCFIHPDGRTLYFSSNGTKSMGGYDIFRTNLDASNQWTLPVNLGYPINTAGDDIFFVVSGDGKWGYYASERKEGKGLQDIYKMNIEPLGYNHSLLLVKGIVSKGDSLAEASVIIKNKATGTEVVSTTSNKKTGKYMLTLPLGVDYEIQVKSDTLPIFKESIAAIGLTSYTEKEINVNLLTVVPPPAPIIEPVKEAEPVTKNEEPENVNLSASTTVKAKEEVETEKEAPAPTPTPAPAPQNTGLVFTVQVAAYNLPNNFKFSHLNDLGKVETRKLDDGVTRFTIGNCKSLEEVQALKQKVIDKGVTDAFIVVFEGGKRKLLSDLTK